MVVAHIPCTGILGITHVAAHQLHGSAMKQFGLKEGALVGICARNRAEWLILRQGMTS